jgi:hypothetical protein
MSREFKGMSYGKCRYDDEKTIATLKMIRNNGKFSN